jgi:hypothetical protein
MTDTAAVPRDSRRPLAGRPVVDEQLADQLLAKAEAEGVELLGPDGAAFAGAEGGAGAGVG